MIKLLDYPRPLAQYTYFRDKTYIVYGLQCELSPHMGDLDWLAIKTFTERLLETHLQYREHHNFKSSGVTKSADCGISETQSLFCNQSQFPLSHKISNLIQFTEKGVFTCPDIR